jgi:hypothetical protein
MRSVTGTLQNAIESKQQYFLARATSYKTRLLGSDFASSSYPITGSDDAGFDTSPLYQVLSINTASHLAVTWYKIGGTLQYSIQDSATLTDTAIAISCKPGYCAGYLWYWDGTYIVKRAVDWTKVTARDATPFSSSATKDMSSKVIVNVIGLSTTEALAIEDIDGGLRPVYIDVGDDFSSDADWRFMFPQFADYTDGSTPSTAEKLAYDFAAIKFGDEVFIYGTEPYQMTIRASVYNTLYDYWEDAFTLLPMEKETSLCSLAVTSAYMGEDNKIYLGCFFGREDAVVQRYYSLVLKSSNGRVFSIDAASVVDDGGYRMQAFYYDAQNKLFLGNSNRILSANATYRYGVPLASSPSTAIDRIISFDDSSYQASLRVAAGKEEYYDDPNIVTGALCIVETGLKTASGDEYITYGTYIVAEVSEGFANAVQTMVIRLLHESMYKLNESSMPFYTEVAGKASKYQEFRSTKNGLLYSAGAKHLDASYETKFRVNFFTHEAYTNSGAGITGVTMMADGGVSWHEAAGSHKLGLVTPGLKEYRVLDDYPVVALQTVQVNLYGWSHSDVGGGSTNDAVDLVMILELPDGTEDTIITTDHYKWPNSYPVDGGGTPPSVNDPIALSVTNLEIGSKIKQVGMVFECATATHFCPSAIQFESGIYVRQPFGSGNLPWSDQDDGLGIMLDGVGVPRVMFATEPYAVTEFSVQADFSDTTVFTWNDDIFPVAWGLVGHATDYKNYVAAVYDRADGVDGTWKIWHYKDGFRTTLASATGGTYKPHTGDLPYSPVRFLFTYRGGTYRLYMKDWLNAKFVEVLSYTWDKTDRWMVENDVPLKVGIFGLIAPPMFRIAGYSYGSSESGNLSDGIACMPEEDSLLNSFAASGEVVINGNVFAYTDIATGGLARTGPYAYLDSGSYGSDYGIELRWFDYDMEDEDLGSVEMLIAAEDGAYLLNGIESRIAGGGSDDDLLNRMILKTANDNSAGKKSKSSQVYLVRGLLGISMVVDNGTSISRWDWCYQNYSGEIRCVAFGASGGDADETVETLSRKIAGMCDAALVFTGNTTGSGDVTTSPQDIATLANSDSIDLYVDYPQLATNDWIGVQLNISFRPDLNDTYCRLDIIKEISNYKAVLRTYPSNGVMDAITWVAASSTVNRVRVFARENFITLYHNGKMIYTFMASDVDWTDMTTITLVGSTTLAGCTWEISEQSDWREAIFMDLETNGASAMEDVIQERPVERYPLSDGSIALSYNQTRDRVVFGYAPQKVEHAMSVPSALGSDTLIYGADDVTVMMDADAMDAVGFKTRVLRLPNLRSGAARAANIVVDRYIQSMDIISVTAHIDYRPEIGDIVVSFYNLPSGRSRTYDFIVEDIQLDSTRRVALYRGRLLAEGTTAIGLLSESLASTTLSAAGDVT